MWSRQRHEKFVLLPPFFHPAEFYHSNFFIINREAKLCVSGCAWTADIKIRLKIQKTVVFLRKQPFFHGPSGEIRTPGILNPNQAPYQLGHTRIFTSSFHAKRTGDILYRPGQIVNGNFCLRRNFCPSIIYHFQVKRNKQLAFSLVFNNKRSKIPQKT